MADRTDYWRRLMAQTVRDELAELRRREKVLVKILEEYDRGNPSVQSKNHPNVA